MQYEIGGSECTSFARAIPVCQQHIKKILRKPRDQVNEITAFIDGSAIYGSDLRKSQKLRNQDGKKRLIARIPSLINFFLINYFQFL